MIGRSRGWRDAAAGDQGRGGPQGCGGCPCQGMTEARWPRKHARAATSGRTARAAGHAASPARLLIALAAHGGKHEGLVRLDRPCRGRMHPGRRDRRYRGPRNGMCRRVRGTENHERKHDKQRQSGTRQVPDNGALQADSLAHRVILASLQRECFDLCQATTLGSSSAPSRYFPLVGRFRAVTGAARLASFMRLACKRSGSPKSHRTGNPLFFAVGKFTYRCLLRRGSWHESESLDRR